MFLPLVHAGPSWDSASPRLMKRGEERGNGCQVWHRAGVPSPWAPSSCRSCHPAGEGQAGQCQLAGHVPVLAAFLGSGLHFWAERVHQAPQSPQVQPPCPALIDLLLGVGQGLRCRLLLGAEGNFRLSLSGSQARATTRSPTGGVPESKDGIPESRQMGSSDITSKRMGSSDITSKWSRQQAGSTDVTPAHFLALS